MKNAVERLTAGWYYRRIGQWPSRHGNRNDPQYNEKNREDWREQQSI